MDPSFDGTISIGAIPYLPIDSLPHNALDLPEPCWVLASEFMSDGYIRRCSDGKDLDTLDIGQAVSVRFEQNGDVVIELDRKGGMYKAVETLAILGTVRDYNEIYPIIDVYGSITQVSAVIHPHYFALSAYKRLGSKNTMNRNWTTVMDPAIVSILVRRGISYVTTSPPCVYFKVPVPPPHYLITIAEILGIDLFVSDEKEFYITNFKKYLSIQNLPKIKNYNEAYTITTKLSRNDAGKRGEICRSGEVNYYEDHIDSEIISALTLEAKDLPDLTEEQSLPYDVSPPFARPTMLSNHHYAYVHRVVCHNQEGIESSSLEAEWESTDGCENLRTILNYWRTLSRPHPELRRAVSWGQVKCYCANCEPNEASTFKGWVRIERIDGVGAASRGFLHLTKNILDSSQTASSNLVGAVRPPTIVSSPNIDQPAFDLWIDDNDIPHLITIAIEIDIEGSNADNDRLLAVLLHARGPISAEVYNA